MRFSTHYKMNAEDIIDYVFEHTGFFLTNENLICEEIGDGNINYVYRIFDTKEKKSVVLKQADIQTRVRPDGYLNPNRNAREAAVLKKQFELAPEFIPKIFHSDKIMAVIIMEDISAYSNLKKELMNLSVFPKLGFLLAEFIAKTTLPLTSLIAGYAKKTEAEFTFYNPELCKITEDLVFTHPYTDERKRNILFEENAEWLRNHFYGNIKLTEAAAKLKNKFCNSPQSLIHGDLHTGSIFVKSEENSSSKLTKLKIIDPEFAFYGPIAYDLGNVLAHFIFAEKFASLCCVANNSVYQCFAVWIKEEQKQLLKHFALIGMEYLKKNIRDSVYKNNFFICNYIEEIIIDAVSFGGAELNRRVIGSAKTVEITSITDSSMRVQFERQIVHLGTKMMLQPKKMLKEMFDICVPLRGSL